jgi:hypothetical protein
LDAFTTIFAVICWRFGIDSLYASLCASRHDDAVENCQDPFSPIKALSLHVKVHGSLIPQCIMAFVTAGHAAVIAAYRTVYLVAVSKSIVHLS